MTTCARTVCNNEGQHEHRDLAGLYCTACARKINEACGQTLIEIKHCQHPTRLDADNRYLPCHKPGRLFDEADTPVVLCPQHSVGK